MTINQLLEASADELEKLSVEQLTEIFKSKFPITRPSEEARAKNAGTSSKMNSAKNPEQAAKAKKLAKARELALKHGIDLGY